jgi:hypothetical protein
LSLAKTQDLFLEPSDFLFYIHGFSAFSSKTDGLDKLLGFIQLLRVRFVRQLLVRACEVRHFLGPAIA